MIKVAGMRKYLQYYGHTEQHINARPTKLLFDQSMDKKQQFHYTFDNRHLLSQKYYMSISNREGKIDYFNSASWKSTDSWLYNTKKSRNNNRNHGTTKTSRTKPCRSMTLLYSTIVKSKENLRNSTQNGWDLTLLKRYIPMDQSN